jgi:hypothetical protein
VDSREESSGAYPHGRPQWAGGIAGVELKGGAEGRLQDEEENDAIQRGTVWIHWHSKWRFGEHWSGCRICIW